MSSQPQRDPVLHAAALFLGLIALAVLVQARRIAEQRESVGIERSRRLELEERLRTRERQLDGALGKISELKADEPAGE